MERGRADARRVVRRGAAMSALALWSGGVAAGLFVYLAWALWRAEEF